MLLMPPTPPDCLRVGVSARVGRHLWGGAPRDALKHCSLHACLCVPFELFPCYPLSASGVPMLAWSTVVATGASVAMLVSLLQALCTPSNTMKRLPEHAGGTLLLI